VGDPMVLLQFDVVAAYLQAPRLPGSADRYVRPPKEMLGDDHATMKNPVTKLEGTLYGEIEAMDAWSLHLHKSLTSLQWVIIDASGGETLYTKKIGSSVLVLGVYVDDGIAHGRRSLLLQELAAISKKVEIDCPKLFNHFLGVHSRKVCKEGHIYRVYEQSHYIRMVIQNFLKDLNGTLKLSRTPGISQKEAEEIRGEAPGVFAKVCRTHLGAVLFVARSTRPDLSEAVGSLAHTVNDWTAGSDYRLTKLMGYLERTKDYALIMKIAKNFSSSDMMIDSVAKQAPASVDILIDSVSDADHAGCVRTSRSTSGWAVYIRDRAEGRHDDTRILLDWGSRRQSVVAKSSTESEIVAINDATTKSTLPIMGYIDAVRGVETETQHRTDSDPARAVALSGASSTLRYMVKHQRVSFAFLKDVWNTRMHGGKRKMIRVDTKLNESDLFTKALPSAPFEGHRDRLGVEDLALYRNLPEFDVEIALTEWEGATNTASAPRTTPSTTRKLANGVWSCPQRAAAAARNPQVRDYLMRILLYIWRNRSAATELLPAPGDSI
jgi:hypothetical protein